VKKVFVICLLALVLAACCTTKMGDHKEEQAHKQTESVESRDDRIKVYDIEDADYNVQVMSHVFGEGKKDSYSVKYAKITGLNDKKVERQINRTLRMAATEGLSEDIGWAANCDLYIRHRSAQYLSLLYWAKWEVSKAGDTRFGITVDMKTGERIFLKNWVANRATLKEHLLNYKYPASSGDFPSPLYEKEINELLCLTSISEEEYYHVDEELFYSLNKDEKHERHNFCEKPTFFLTEEQLVITRDGWVFNDIYIDLSLLR
jgi:hypothetical protein